jgi:hypothetical protein
MVRSFLYAGFIRLPAASARFNCIYFKGCGTARRLRLQKNPHLAGVAPCRSTDGFDNRFQQNLGGLQSDKTTQFFSILKQNHRGNAGDSQTDGIMPVLINI